MATRLLTQDIVYAAANKLVAQGKRPSNRAVLHEIGFGSMTTLAQLMNDWRNNAPAIVATAQPLPAGLLRELESLQRNIEKTVRTECAADLEDAQDSEQLLIQENEQLLGQVTALQVELQAAREDATTAQAQLTQIHADHAALKLELNSERASVAELRIELAKASLRIDETMPRLMQELVECREQLNLARKAQTDAELKAAVSRERVTGLEQRLVDLQVS
ncbi:UNVERIFIED_ORG: chromosome segregation ATPase [Comamonas terrigena]